MITDKALWIFELKVDRSADEALMQIEERRYPDKYAALIEEKHLAIKKVGISFSSETRKIADWKTV